MHRTTLSVSGMSCDGCERNVESALQNLEGVSRVDADHAGDTVEIVVEEDTDETEVHAAIEGAGYDVSA
ncbi:MAG: heavy-metal-associated domain-containing protein [Halobacteriales archaeon]